MLRLPSGITTSANPPPYRATSVLRDGVKIGEYSPRYNGGYRWRTAEKDANAYGDAATAHLAILAIIEIADRRLSDSTAPGRLKDKP